MLTCPSHKKSYSSQAFAEDALVEAWIKFEYASGSGPIAVYRCEECGQYHFTSKGVMNEKLSTALTTGKIKKQKEGNDWLTKLKRNK